MQEIIDRLTALQDEGQARHLSRFFKTGKGQYGEGDRFLGIKVPVTRAVVKEYRNLLPASGPLDLSRFSPLITSEWHEVRLAGFLLFIELFNKVKKDDSLQKQIVDYYLANIQYGNNWDLVDLVAPKLLGEWLVKHQEERVILDTLASMAGSLWHQRVAIVATFALIYKGSFEDTFRISRTLLDHPHDLIHKAVGWMLREAGKRGGHEQLIYYLDQYAAIMPRTMLRYSIEKFPEPLRRHYLTLRPQ